MVKLNFFDLPVFFEALRKVEPTLRYNRSTAFACWSTAAEMRRSDISGVIMHTHPQASTDLSREEYLSFCEEQWVDELMERVEEIINDKPVK